MLSVRQNILRSSASIITILRAKSSSSNSDDIGWSHGEKQKPQNWKYSLEYWYKITDHQKLPFTFDPEDPEHQYPYKLPDGGIRYFNFIYYPRNPDHKEPEIKPSKLLLVYRRKPLKHRPYWEKHIMKKLGIDTYGEAVVTVVKNIPEVNAMLWQVKHLVTIKPLRFPENMPEDRNPLHYFINEDGEVTYTPSVKVTEEDLKDVKTEKDMDVYWVNEQTRKIYDNSLKLEF